MKPAIAGQCLLFRVLFDMGDATDDAVVRGHVHLTSDVVHARQVCFNFFNSFFPCLLILRAQENFVLRACLNYAHRPGRRDVTQT